MNKKYLIHFLIAALYVAKLGVDLFGEVAFTDDTMYLKGFSFHKRYSSVFNVDEYEMSRTAKYVLQGKGYLTDVSFDKPDFRPGKITVSALRPKYQIYAHLLGIKVYTWFNPGYSLATPGDLPADYYEGFAFLTLVMKNAFLILSLFYFYRLVRILFNKTLAGVLTAFYLVYPSLFFYVGIFNIHDCTVAYCVVIVVSMLVRNYYHRREYTVTQAVSVGLLLVIGLLKSQAILIALLTLPVLLLLYFPRIPMHLWRFALVAGAVLGIGLAPVLYRNYQDYGRFFLTSQSGVTFFIGHNPLARGSWYPGIWQAEGGMVTKQLEAYRSELSKGEMAESDVYKRLAMTWIKENPGKEAILTVRKTAILFLPYNFLNLKVNVFTLLAHLGFFGFCCLFVLRYRRFHKAWWLIVAPIAATILMNVIFYVEYRWRLFADPFILICAASFYLEMAKEWVGKRRNAAATETAKVA